MHELAGLAQVRVIGEGGGKLDAVVMIAGQYMVRHAQRVEHLLEVRVFLRAPEVGQVAADDDQVRRWLQAVERRHGRRQVAVGLDHAIGLLARHADVQVADLGDKHGVRCSRKFNGPPAPR
ncbi:Uncharacterised protein [Bordetella pertussis]|nr:Uncharacterised protein [Bordetella pertussis]